MFACKSVPALEFQIHGFQKFFFFQNERGEYDLKVEKVQNAPHFPYFLEKFILQTSCFIAFA